MTEDVVPLSADLWRLLGQREGLNEVSEWHLKESERLKNRGSQYDLVQALWHLRMIEVIFELDKAISAEIRQKKKS